VILGLVCDSKGPSRFEELMPLNEGLSQASYHNERKTLC
jgi:hypothetical protein